MYCHPTVDPEILAIIGDNYISYHTLLSGWLERATN